MVVMRKKNLLQVERLESGAQKVIIIDIIIISYIHREEIYLGEKRHWLGELKVNEMKPYLTGLSHCCLYFVEEV